MNFMVVIFICSIECIGIMNASDGFKTQLECRKQIPKIIQDYKTQDAYKNVNKDIRYYGKCYLENVDLRYLDKGMET